MRQYYKSNKKGKIEVAKVPNRLATVFLVIIFILFISSISQTSKKIQKVNVEVTEREEELEKLKNEQENLKLKLEEVTSQEHIEKQLRNELNLVKGNETILVLPPDEVLMRLLPVVEEERVEITPNWQKWAELFRIFR